LRTDASRFFADDVDTGGHGTLAPSNVSIGRMSAWREPFESVKRKYAKVLGTETVCGWNLLGREHKCRQCSAPSGSKFIVIPKGQGALPFILIILTRYPANNLTSDDLGFVNIMSILPDAFEVFSLRPREYIEARPESRIGASG
jgi:hypothetical protein